MRLHVTVVTTRSVLAVGIVAAIAFGGVAYYEATKPENTPTLVTAAVTRGDIVEVVDATGTLQAVTTVQVGTQVSGAIKSLHADFNSQVRRGQVIARLEPSLFDTQVAQARASLVRLEAEALRSAVQRDDAERKLRRAQELAAKQLIAATELETAEMNARQADAGVKAAEAQIVQARASLNQSEVNLAHTVITAPIDGIVISRNVDVGQTVAASMQAPTLFVIARDLRAMQVNASVGESDIGRIQPGQSVSFRVDAYPADVFEGRVAQVRLEPVVQQNVVSYVTTIDVPNAELKLKPGMTANVTIEIERAAAVLRVPNAALRVRPSAEVLAALGEPPPELQAEPALDARTHERAPAGRGTADVRARGRRAEVWVLTDGRLTQVPVRVGISDGSHTAVLAGDLADGALVVTSITVQPDGTTSTSSSPLLPFGARMPGGGRGGTPSRPPGR
jgi:HlyD family secretion protein